MECNHVAEILSSIWTYRYAAYLSEEMYLLDGSNLDPVPSRFLMACKCGKCVQKGDRKWLFSEFHMAFVEYVEIKD